MSHEDLITDAWAHISMSVDRVPVSRGLYPCMLSNSVVYSFQKDLIISGQGHMKLMGWPEAMLPDEPCSDSEYRDLAGNGFSAPIATIIGVACIMNVHAPWWAGQ